VLLTIDDLLTDIQLMTPTCNKVYLLKDCTSPVVVVPGLVTTQPEEDAASSFAAAGGAPSQILRTNQQLA